jgi:hypothetical protein
MIGITFLFLLLNSFITMQQQESINPKIILADFTLPETRALWSVVNDDVMGGVSTSKILVSENNTLLFSGDVSLDNNGGFASLRSPIKDYNFSNYDGFLVKVKGDGKTYSMSFRQTKYFTGYNFNLRFETEKDQWQIIKLPFADFKLKYYGREVSDYKPPDKSEIKQLSVLISDKQEGSFRLEIKWIKLL